MLLSLSRFAAVCLATMAVVPQVSGLPTDRRMVVRRGSAGRLNARTENATETVDPLTIQIVNATETASLTEIATETAIPSVTATEEVLVTETATATDLLQATSTNTGFATPTATPFFHGTIPVDQSVFPKINSWGTCNDFLRSNGINLFPNDFNSFDVFIQEVTVIQIFIDDRGRVRRRRNFNYFPPPQDYFPEFDLRIEQNKIIAIDGNGFGGFDNKFDDKFDDKFNDKFNDKFDFKGNGRGNGRGKQGGGIDKDDINDLVKSILS